MHPRALIAWVAAVLALSLGTEDPVYRAVALVAALTVFLVRSRSELSPSPYLVWMAGAALLAVAFNTLLSHTGANVLVTVPGSIPAVGGPLTLEGVVYGADIALGLTASLLAASTLTTAVTSQELLESLPSRLHRTSAALGAALTLLPRLRTSFVAVREAQRMRGWRPRGPRSWTAVVVPALLTAVEGSVQLAEAMEARGFGSGPRTRVWSRSLTGRGWTVVIASLVAITLVVVGSILGGSGWQPYPTLQAPTLQPALSVGAMLLFIPAVAG